MFQIVVSGGDCRAAVDQMTTALREIFNIEAKEIAVPNQQGSPNRNLDLLAIALTIPSAAIATADILERSRLGERLARLIRRAEEQAKKTGARLLIDVGDGRPIPIEQARRDEIQSAIQALRHRRK